MSQQCHIIVMESSLYLHLNCYCAFCIFILFVNGCAPCSITEEQCHLIKIIFRHKISHALRGSRRRRANRDIKMATPEYSVVKAHIADINSRISAADISSYADDLFQAGLIGQPGHDNALAITGIAPQGKV